MGWIIISFCNTEEGQIEGHRQSHSQQKWQYLGSGRQ